ncbi:MAG TPA: PilN domain-containing protein [Sedimentisphaerales bacterium]|nr:PilN domain-containing protein [Sedimentisphaerales bacterium]
MVDVNFVPDDYTQSNESHRTNFIYLVLFAVLMTALGGSFAALKIRQRDRIADEELVNKKLAEEQEAIKQLEELQAKRREMMKTALTTAELVEPVPRSILLASLTNNLPTGVSLLDLKLVQKQGKPNTPVAPTSKYQAAQTQKGSQANAQEADAPANPEKLLETHIDIGGIAPSDLQVSKYMERMTNSNVLDNVELVESKEYIVEGNTLRQFKLRAMLKKDVHLTKEDVEIIRSKAVNSVWTF